MLNTTTLVESLAFFREHFAWKAPGLPEPTTEEASTGGSLWPSTGSSVGGEIVPSSSKSSSSGIARTVYGKRTSSYG